jgi:hypothetical protein
MKSYQDGPKVKQNIKETLTLHFGKSKAKQGEKREKPTRISKLGPTCIRDEAQDQQEAHRPKQGRRGGTQGAGAPLAWARLPHC